MTLRMGNLLAVGLVFLFGVAAENPRHRAEDPVPVGPPGTEPLSPEASDSRPTQWNPDPNGGIRGASSPGTRDPVASNPDAPKGEPGEVDPCAQKNPVSVLEAIPEMTTPRAAPQGGVYFLGTLKDVSQVYYLKSPKDLPERRTQFERGVTQFTVSPDGQQILTLRSVDGSRNWQLDLVSKKHALGLRLSTPNDRVESAVWITSNRIAFSSTAEGNLWKLNVMNLEESAQPLGTFQQPLQVLDATSDGSQLLLSRLLSGEQREIQVWDLNKNKPVPPQIIASLPLARFSADGKGVFLLSDRGKGPVRLYHYDRESGGDLRLLSPKAASVDQFGLNPDRSHLFYSTVKHGYHQITGLQIDSRGRTRKGQSAPEPGPWVFDGLGPAQSSLFLVRSNARHSHNLWQWQDQKWVQWTQAHRPLLHPLCIPMPEYVEYPGQDALPIPAFLYRPAQSGSTVIRLPRFAGEGFLPAFHRDILYFVQRGYGVLVPNLRGAPFGSRKFRDLDNGAGRIKAVGDIVAGAQWLNQGRIAASGKVGLFGTHYGGTLALLALAQQPDVFLGAFVGEPVLTATDFVARAPAAEKPALLYEFGLMEGAPWAGSLSPGTGLAALGKPTLSFEGGAVQLASPKPSALREFLKASPPPFEGAPVPTQQLKWAQRAAFGIFQDKKGKGP